MLAPLLRRNLFHVVGGLLMLSRAVLLVLSMLLPLTALAQTNLTGYWKFSIPNGGVSYLELKQSGDSVTSIGRGGPARALAGDVHNGTLRLEGSAGPAGVNRNVVYEAKVKGESFPMTRQYTGQPLERGTLERVAKDEAQPPRLPFPVLRDLPDNGLVRTPPMGWNSWNKFHDKFDDATVRAMADAMVTGGMRDAGYTYIIVDEGWSSYRDKNGNITGNARFPDMKALAEYVHAKGLKIGIYSSPGPQVCGGYQGSYGHEEQDAKTFADWGYDYLKYDWCSAFGIYQPTPADLEGAYQKMGEALEKTGRPIVYSLCEYGLGDVWEWGAKAGGNLWRTTFDIADNWQSMEKNGFSQLDITTYPAAGHWNDPDMLEVGNGGMTGDEYRTHMSLWALLRAPLIAGNDLRTMSDETKSILMNLEVIAIDQDGAAKPVRVLTVAGQQEVLVRRLTGDAVAVGLFNRGDAPAQMSVRWDSLHLFANLGGRTLSARDLWQHSDVPVAGDSFTAMVPKHGVVLLRVEASAFHLR
jgi:alpha-galactosidase